jgi:hypothetical protein
MGSGGLSMQHNPLLRRRTRKKQLRGPAAQHCTMFGSAEWSPSRPRAHHCRLKPFPGSPSNTPITHCRCSISPSKGEGSANFSGATTITRDPRGPQGFSTSVRCFPNRSNHHNGRFSFCQHNLGCPFNLCYIAFRHCKRCQAIMDGRHCNKGARFFLGHSPAVQAIGASSWSRCRC